MTAAGTTAGRGRRSRRSLVVLGLAGIVAFAGFIALGVWQLERRTWKLDLIDRVDARVHAETVAAPGPGAWAGISAANDEYRRVSAAGRYLNDRETLVQATTALGGGFWVLTPFRTDTGFTILVNRGFVPPDRRDPATRADGQMDGETIVTGLLRLTEPGGGFLRSNQPGADRWYSRDVAAIAAARGVTGAAPYFIDADAGPAPWPRGGLTVIAFPNSHLVYAVTWFGLALLTAAGAAVAVRAERRRHHG